MWMEGIQGLWSSSFPRVSTWVPIALKSTFFNWVGCRGVSPYIFLLIYSRVVSFSRDLAWYRWLIFMLVKLLFPMLRWGAFWSLGSRFPFLLPIPEWISTSSRFVVPPVVDSTWWSTSPRPGMMVGHWRCYLIISFRTSFRIRTLRGYQRLLLNGILTTRVWGIFLHELSMDLFSLIWFKETLMHQVEIMWYTQDVPQYYLSV